MLTFDSREAARKCFLEVGAHCAGAAIMSKKSKIIAIKLYDLPCVRANVLKQEMLARGGDACVSAKSVGVEASVTDAVLFGALPVFESLLLKLASQPLKFKKNIADIRAILESERVFEESGPPPFAFRDGTLELAKKTHVMGILNVTPDSFSDGGCFSEFADALKQAELLFAEGADIVDIGGESSRPGACEVSAKEELRRVLPVVEALHAKKLGLISIDTWKSKVADEALKRGASIVNDISALRDPDMSGIVRKRGAGLILMHMRGDPRSMQRSPRYRSLLGEITGYLRAALEKAMAAGINKASVLLDPGIGFGKTLSHNLGILRRLGELKTLGCGIVVGASRKSFIGALTDGLSRDQQAKDREPKDRIVGSLAAAALAISGGANVLRVHDVKEHVELARVMDAVRWSERT
jgi:dihydropteroate synthase